jgi:hypothetical protein
MRTNATAGKTKLENSLIVRAVRAGEGGRRTFRRTFSTEKRNSLRYQSSEAQRKTWFSYEWEELLERGEKEGEFGSALGRYKYLFARLGNLVLPFPPRFGSCDTSCLPSLFASPSLPACLALLPGWISKRCLELSVMAQGYRIKKIPISCCLEYLWRLQDMSLLHFRSDNCTILPGAVVSPNSRPI